MINILLNKRTRSFLSGWILIFIHLIVV